jgi:hypothetical protein
VKFSEGTQSISDQTAENKRFTTGIGQTMAGHDSCRFLSRKSDLLMRFSQQKLGFSLAQLISVVIETAFCLVPRGSFATSSFKIQGQSQLLRHPLRAAW